jgi:uncharacterized protein
VADSSDFAWPSQPKVVVDTNMLLSAALSPTGAPATLLEWLLTNGILVLSSTTFSELQTRIFKPKFDRYLSLETRKQILHDLSAAAFWIEISADLAGERYCRDTDDDAFVHAAIAADACVIVTGDADLLVLDPIDGLRILTPRMALDSV